MIAVDIIWIHMDHNRYLGIYVKIFFRSQDLPNSLHNIPWILWLPWLPWLLPAPHAPHAPRFDSDSDLLKSAISGLCARTAGDTAAGVLPWHPANMANMANMANIMIKLINVCTWHGLISGKLCRKAGFSSDRFSWNHGNHPIFHTPRFDQSAQMQSTGQSFLVHTFGNVSSREIWQTKKDRQSTQ